MPKVSVLMPVYKTDEKYLREAIESILNQSFTDFEFLILDDCPQDDREEIVKSYADKRIKYSKNPHNMGITPTRNKLIDMAKGEYLAVFDHDDISLPTRFEKEVSYMDTHPETGVVSCRVMKMSNHRLSKNPTANKDIKLALVRTCSLTHPAAMIRKSVLNKHNIRYEEAYSPAEDYALWCRLIPYTEFHNLDEVLFHYRDHAGNTSHLQAEQMTNVTYAIWSFVKHDNPILYEEFLSRATYKMEIKLFGILPFLKIVTKDSRSSVYLFEKIKLFTCKNSLKIQEKR